MRPEDDVCIDAPLPAGLRHAWQLFLAGDADRPRGLDLYEEIFSDELLFPLQRKRELAAMMRLARSIEPRTVMEIGADKGGSFYHWIKCLPTVERAIAIEVRGVPYADLFAQAFDDVAVLLGLACSSLTDATAAALREFLSPRSIDCLFMDGAKAWFARDWDLYAPMVRPGGLIFVHDINEGGPHAPAPPAEFFRSIAAPYETSTIIDTSEIDDAARREAHGLPPADSYEAWLRYWKTSSCGVGVIRVP